MSLELLVARRGLSSLGSGGICCACSEVLHLTAILWRVPLVLTYLGHRLFSYIAGYRRLTIHHRDHYRISFTTT